jgi:hypothetical protein
MSDSPAYPVGEITVDSLYLRDAFARMTRTRRRRTIAIYLVMLSALAAVIANGRGFDRGSTFGFLFLAATMFSIPPFVSRFVARRAYLKSPHRGRKLRFEWSDEGVRMSSPTGDAHLAWAGLVRVVRFPDGLLLFRGPYAATWIPSSAYADPHDAARVETLVRSKLANVRSMT